MTDRWRDRLERVDQAVDRVMSETLQIVPMLESEYSSRQTDPARAAFEVEGVLSVERGDTDLGGSSRQIRNARVTTSKAELQIQTVLLVGRPEIRKNDRVFSTAKDTTFKVDRIDRLHPGRLAFTLSIDGSAE